METSKKTTVDWFIIFTQSRCKMWLMKFLKKNFSHVYAAKKSPGGQFWIIVNPLLPFLSCELLLVDQYPHPRLFVENGAVILPVKAYIKNEARWAFCVFNCVEVVKALLGIKSFWVFTPWQLYKYLTKGVK